MSKRSERLYLSPPHMSDEKYEEKYVHDVFQSNWVAPAGPHLRKFENMVCEYIGMPEALAVSSGTAALHLILKYFDIGGNDDVFCSSLTFGGSSFPITYEGANPVFIDSDITTWNMDPNLLESALKKRAGSGNLPKAVIVVDIYGQSADYDEILKVCSRYPEIIIIEDAAESLGAEYKGTKTGNFGNAAFFSFNGNKIITTSGGGMIVSNNKELIDYAGFLSTQAKDNAPHYQHSHIGYNYRMSNISAAIGMGQLEVIDDRIKRRREIFNRYYEKLSQFPGIKFMPEPDFCLSTRWLTCILIDPKICGTDREEIRLSLEEHNIESRPLWKPMHLQPVFQSCEKIGGEVSAKLFKTGLCLPSGTAMSNSDIDEICEIIISRFKS